MLKYIHLPRAKRERKKERKKERNKMYATAQIDH